MELRTQTVGEFIHIYQDYELNPHCPGYRGATNMDLSLSERILSGFKLRFTQATNYVNTTEEYYLEDPLNINVYTIVYPDKLKTLFASLPRKNFGHKILF